MFKNFTTENWLTLWSIGAPVIISSFSFLIHLYVNFVDEREKNRPIIFVSFHKYHENGFLNTELKIKNYGISVGWIKNIEISPFFESEKDSKSLDPNRFTKFKNFPLAPHQEISFLIAVGEEAAIKYVEDRQFIIKYEAHFATKIFSKKMYIDNYSIDEINYPTTLSEGNYTEEYRLKKINDNIISNNKIIEKVVNKGMSE
ncbi:hypothetical protein EQI52_06110 [Leuconostoc mesenteroides]|uniref:hypothetical protein n=1 Tax=Leuconostoc mesenteroides TaxID=1245 RepID=UPI000FFCDD37|nr:hypothetical protein [Leuconostoc mesenteroides]QAR69383.1 hypothetical protein EQI52_06110 [Leuconostoc mesenteroides]WJM73888.1 hypothetical protein QTN54_03740 [Leuconostoc mesenteroides]